ncbi:glycoside hydrolase family 16 protein [Novosphingobium sp. FSW06-99]|uniref:glycoside hydrolase family 16 protein n=1 Tax=Novosphingobium sp. FSW06-99 TaxID=1739113 RepID=UPI00076CEE30|nr:glycoside hydrolase family 16 protein [Novosphingobium sp. FSW06-99]KUR80130.1 hypothetical protein AQZ49_03295 [Novosphingobium sp. FSW06-99]
MLMGLALMLIGGQSAIMSGCASPRTIVDADFSPLHHAIHPVDDRLHGIIGQHVRDTLQISGPWLVGHEGFMTPALAQVSEQDPSGLNDPGKGYLRLSTVRDGGRTLASEVMSDGFPGTARGYYETRMVVDPEHRAGGCLSFFWIQARDTKGRSWRGASFGPLEIDIEFLANEPWATHPDQPGYVHFTLHPSNTTWRQPLPFNPSTGYHRYGFLWVANRVIYTVDGKPVHAMTEPGLSHAPPNGGWMMANVWSGPRDWGGVTPEQPVSAVYNRMVHFGGVARIIPYAPRQL